MTLVNFQHLWATSTTAALTLRLEHFSFSPGKRRKKKERSPNHQYYTSIGHTMLFSIYFLKFFPSKSIAIPLSFLAVTSLASIALNRGGKEEDLPHETTSKPHYCKVISDLQICVGFNLKMKGRTLSYIFCSVLHRFEFQLCNVSL